VTQLSKNFNLKEFSVSAGHPELALGVPPGLIYNVTKLVADVLQPLRDAWKKPLKILSGYRSDALNKAVGGSPTSQHRKAQAADVTTDDVRGLFVRLFTEPRLPVGQVIGFVHIATPSERYPAPTFFISRSKKVYTRVSSLAALNSLWPKR
jgi:zinc D-Ala-D-Ala carboxypeptidase